MSRPGEFFLFALAEKQKALHPRYLKRYLSCSDIADWMAYYQARAEMAKQPDEMAEEPDEDRPMSDAEISDNLMQWKAFAEAKRNRQE